MKQEVRLYLMYLCLLPNVQKLQAVEWAV